MNVTNASKVLWERGVRILEGNRIGDNDEEHVKELANYMRLNGERKIADMGCGFGEVSRILAQQFPDMLFYLINNNEFQLSKCPQEHRYDLHMDDMCNVSLPDGFVDLVMFNWSLCHVKHEDALREAYRITMDKGKLFVYDYERVRGNNVLTQKYLSANFFSDSDFRKTAEAVGWRNVETHYPGGDDRLFRESAGNDVIYDAEVSDRLIPVIWRARK